MIERGIKKQIESRLFKGKAIILYGARQVGKTTLMKEIAAQYGEEGVWLNCDEPEPQILLSNVSSTKYKEILGKKRILFIDEAQRVKNIGIALKIFVDNFPDKQVIATGSSSFDLANDITEPLTGRTYNFQLFPFSMSELQQLYQQPFELERVLESRLIFGTYPDVVLRSEEAEELLGSIATAYLFKDIFAWQNVKNPDMLLNLLRALALQVGNEVSFSELAKLVGITKETVMSYINLLEKTFVIFRLQPLARNLRNEIGTSRKIYFFDNGIRNALIANLNPLELRQDVGALWENFLVSERYKLNAIHRRLVNTYFWRTYQQQEIDYIEESGGEFRAYEFKWNPGKKASIPSAFLKNYPGGGGEIINKDNFKPFLGC
jgi:predicted AAA+ superfamily ATPase